MLKLRILCLDDDPVTLRILENGLSKALPDDTIEGRNNSPEGLELQKSNPFDILITDLHMPEMNGMEVIDNVKLAGHETEIIVLTAISEIKTVVEAMSKGARDYVQKPIFIELLVEKIEAIRQDKQSLNIACEAEAGLRAIEEQAQNTISELSQHLNEREERIQKAIQALESQKEPEAILKLLKGIDA